MALGIIHSLYIPTQKVLSISEISLFVWVYRAQNWYTKFTFVESSCSFVCSAIKRTQKQLLCISGGQCWCENAGLLIMGLLMPSHPLSSGKLDKSSDSDCVNGIGPCIWQLPPNGPVPVKLRMNIIGFYNIRLIAFWSVFLDSAQRKEDGKKYKKNQPQVLSIECSSVQFSTLFSPLLSTESVLVRLLF